MNELQPMAHDDAIGAPTYFICCEKYKSHGHFAECFFDPETRVVSVRRPLACAFKSSLEIFLS
eukprot:7254261-Pyramimonas_sp.AAC.1